MLAWSSTVPDLVVALVLFSLVGLLLARRRWEAQNVLLAAFLSLVGIGFLANALAVATGDLLWWQVDLLAFCFDPLLLLAFVTEHPYVRRTRLHRVALAWLALAGAACAAVVVLDPRSIVASYANPSAPARLLLMGGVLAFGYTLAWSASVASLRHAPTDGLAQRAGWSCLAVGVAVVPRIPYVLSSELALLPAHPGPGLQVAHLLVLCIAAALVLPALAGVRAARNPHAARRKLAAVAAIAATLLLVDVGLDSVGLEFNHPFALRWIVFSGLLVYAILAHQVLHVPAWARRFLPLLGAGVAALVAGSTALSLLAGTPLDAWATAAIVLGAGLGAATPGAWAARALLHWIERTPGASRAERRLVLYSAAVESALAGDTVGRLASARRHLGLSREEARVVEDLVRRDLARPPRPLRPGDEPIPGIVVERSLAGGTQASTFLARHLPGGEGVVVKQLATAMPTGARRRLWKELDALRTLQHPGLPRLLGFSLDPVPCVAYDYIPGRTLAQTLQRGPLAEDRVRALANDLLAALDAVHAAGFVHGDVKPSNIVLGSNGRAHLIDFGLAEARPPARATLAHQGRSQPAGTLEYMSPELARTGKASAAADVFALGLVMHEAATGRRARLLHGLAVYQALERVAREPVNLERTPLAWLPFLEAALQPDPRRRPSVPDLRRLVPARQADRPSRRGLAVPTA